MLSHGHHSCCTGHRPSHPFTAEARAPPTRLPCRRLTSCLAHPWVQHSYAVEARVECSLTRGTSIARAWFLERLAGTCFQQQWAELCSPIDLKVLAFKGDRASEKR